MFCHELCIFNITTFFEEPNLLGKGLVIFLEPPLLFE